MPQLVWKVGNSFQMLLTKLESVLQSTLSVPMLPWQPQILDKCFLALVQIFYPESEPQDAERKNSMARWRECRE